jgi:hypothetical protein
MVAARRGPESEATVAMIQAQGVKRGVSLQTSLNVSLFVEDPRDHNT